MYKVMGFKEAVATRKVFLLNEETGTRETCFDDSALKGYENFSFMKQGERYECKIKLTEPVSAFLSFICTGTTGMI